MAKFGTYYGLCPIIDHRSLLGISEDEVNGQVIVTLGKNIAIKYKLSDQKQLHSWRTKEKYTSPVIFDKKSGQYVAVFNRSYLRTWTGNEESVDKLKKLKFNQEIHTIFTFNGTSFILFKNGGITTLEEALEKRKDLNLKRMVDVNTEYIFDTCYCSHKGIFYIGLVVKSEDNKSTHLCWTRFNTEPEDKFNKITLQRENVDMVGYELLVDNNEVKFISLWEDGRLYFAALTDSDIDPTSPGELFTCIDAISCKNYVSLKYVGENYLVFYGCDCSDEGALLILFNVQFKVIQYKLSFKLFTNGAKMWDVQGNIFLPVGQNLAVVPYVLESEQLAALIGSHKSIEVDPDVTIIQKVQEATWDDEIESNLKIPPGLTEKIEEFSSQGLSENLIIEQLLGEKNEDVDLQVAADLLRNFLDVPEKSLSRMLSLVLKEEEERKSIQELSKEQRNLINLILSKSFSEILLLPHLRADLNIEKSLKLLTFIQSLIANEQCLPKLNSTESSAKLINWGCTILDANYQTFLLSKDKEIAKILTDFNETVKEELQSIENMQQVVSLVSNLKKHKVFGRQLHVASLSYSVEEMSLY